MNEGIENQIRPDDQVFNGKFRMKQQQEWYKNRTEQNKGKHDK